MAFTKAKIVMAGLAVTAVCIVAPQQLKAQVPEAQMDGFLKFAKNRFCKGNNIDKHNHIKLLCKMSSLLNGNRGRNRNWHLPRRR